MNYSTRVVRELLLGSVLALGSTQLLAGPAATVTLMQMSDLHGKMVPHQEIFQGGRAQNYSGGLTKMAGAIAQVRSEDPDALLLAIGDTTHGSAEALFSMGDALMEGLNSLGIDVFTPGNWDFGYGARVFRNRFAGVKLPLSPNNRTSLTAIRPAGACPGAPGTGPGTGHFTCNVTPASFDAVAINLYNYNDVAGVMGPNTLPRFKILEENGVKVGVIGITTDVVPQQAKVFNLSFRFSMGYNELPSAIADAKDAGADIIVVMSELGLSKNLQIVKDIPGVDVMFSGHTHERTYEPIIVKQNNGGKTIVTEAGEDTHLGRLTLTVKNGAIDGYDWELIELDDAMPEDPAMKAIVDANRYTFVRDTDRDGVVEPGEDGLTCHTFGPGGFAYGKGHTLCEDIDTVVGTTLVTLERRDVLEDISNNFMVDAFVEAGRQADPSLNADNSLSTTNGFRYDNVVLGKGTLIGDGPATASGNITIGDLYAYYPIGAALALADYSGGRLYDHYENILSHVFDRNPYRQRGGWNLGFTENMHFDIDLVNLPLSISYAGRIVDIMINGQKWDRSKTYTVVSCYPHGNPVDEACRTSGAFNFRFMTGTPDVDGEIGSPWGFTTPVNDENITDPSRTPIVIQAAPDNFVHPVDILREYLASNVVDGINIGALGRVNSIGGHPVSECDPTLVQPIQGAGPDWLARDVEVPCRPQDN